LFAFEHDRGWGEKRKKGKKKREERPWSAPWRCFVLISRPKVKEREKKKKEEKREANGPAPLLACFAPRDTIPPKAQFSSWGGKKKGKKKGKLSLLFVQRIARFSQKRGKGPCLSKGGSGGGRGEGNWGGGLGGGNDWGGSGGCWTKWVSREGWGGRRG